MLLGLGLAGGIFRNNGRYTAAEECLGLGGGGRLFEVMDGAARHVGIGFPGHDHASLYDVVAIEPDAQRFLAAEGVEVLLERRVTGVRKRGRDLLSVTVGGEDFAGQAFVDATGSAGPPGNCVRHGNGCAMCVLRCPSYGPRVGPASLAGVRELSAWRSDGQLGSFSGSCDLRKDSLEPWLRERLEADGVAVIPLSVELRDPSKLRAKACQQYNLPAFGENLVLLDTGAAKLMSPYFPLARLRELPGFRRARFEDPAAGGHANSVRFMGLVPHDARLRVSGLANLLCAGEKCGPQVGHTEAVATGMLAGHNAARSALGLEPVTLPRELAVGDFVACVTWAVRRRTLEQRLSFSGAGFFARMRERGTYTTDRNAVRGRLERLGLLGALDLEPG
jgi:hypothetical protein